MGNDVTYRRHTVMSKPTLPNSNNLEKSNQDNQPNRYEQLCNKLQQMKSITNIATRDQGIKQQELFDVLCSLTDMLTQAILLCDNLTPQEVPTYQKTRIV